MTNVKWENKPTLCKLKYRVKMTKFLTKNNKFNKNHINCITRINIENYNIELLQKSLKRSFMIRSLFQVRINSKIPIDILLKQLEQNAGKSRQLKQNACKSLIIFKLWNSVISKSWYWPRLNCGTISCYFYLKR